MSGHDRGGGAGQRPTAAVTAAPPPQAAQRLVRAGPSGRAARTARVPRWVAPAAVGVAGLAGCVALAVLDPATRDALSPGCPFRALTGWDCPGCGGTRALYALLHGDVFAAAGHNALTLILLPVLVWAWAGWLQVGLGRRAAVPMLRPKLSMALAVIFVVFMVVRNLPWLPFAHLAAAPLG